MAANNNSIVREIHQKSSTDAKPMMADTPLSVATLMVRLQGLIYQITGAGSTVRQIAIQLEDTDVGVDANCPEIIISALGRNIYQLGEEAYEISEAIRNSLNGSERAG
ncbi:hypothetical protein [Collimonas silvisoli]|uniref:hypothetical protein n=1 Tax=Collimonas silvisoli TaxID=2825884 RepID=UPI001B8BB3AF|nr:hypothetical protein [Collimonas silvisoli]